MLQSKVCTHETVVSGIGPYKIYILLPTGV